MWNFDQLLQLFDRWFDQLSQVQRKQPAAAAAIGAFQVQELLPHQWKRKGQ
jgi:hypothetical protein